MQTIGLIGGVSWESSAAYYEGINKGVQQRLGGRHSASVVLASVDFAEVMDALEQGRLKDVAATLAAAAQGVEAAGADFVLLCSTTFHIVYDAIAAAVSIPVIHLADVVAERCKASGVTTVGFLGTALTAEHDFFVQRLSDRGINVNLPDPLHVETIDSIIYDELVFRTVTASSRRRVISIIDELWDAGTDGVLLGATELSLLVRQQDVEVPVLDVITVHVEAALERALG